MKPFNYTKQLSLPALLVLPYRIDPWYQIVKTLIKLAKAVIGPLAVTATASFIDRCILIAKGSEEFSSLIMPIIIITASFFSEPIGDFLLGALTPYHAELEWEKTEYPLSRRAASLKMKDLENEELRSEISIYTDGYTAFGLEEQIRNFIFRAISLVSYFVIIGTYLPWVAIAAVILSIPMCLLSFSNEKEAFLNEKARRRRSAYNGRYREYLSGRGSVGERTVFGFSPFVTEKYISSLNETNRDNNKVQIEREKRHYISVIFQYALCFIAVVLLIKPLVSQEITIGVFSSVVQALFVAVPMLISGFLYDTYFIFCMRRHLKQFNKFLSLSTDVGLSDSASKDAPAFESIELKNVSFAYPGSEKKVLSNVNLKISAGQKTALVGENGSGKSTLCKLILGYYDDYEGEILLNGIDIRKWDKADIKAMVTALTQNFSRYDVTLEDNICLGEPFTEEEVDRAVSLSGLTDIIKRLPKGKKTMLGKLYEEGVDLSGGEWQRVAMARMIIRNTGLMLLDEPTASLDPMAERDVYEQYDSITKDSATILVSHRLGAVKTADVIYVLENGTVSEVGSHAELMDKNGLYAKMYESQRGWYI